MKIRSFVLFVVLAAVVSVAACGSSSPAAPTSVTSISVTGGAPAVGATAQFTAIATVAGGTTEDITTSAAWSSSDPTVATVSSSGLVTGVSAGAVVISATFSSVIGAESISVP